MDTAQIITICLYGAFLIGSIIVSTLALIRQKRELPNPLKEMAQNYELEVQRETLATLMENGVEISKELQIKALKGININQELNSLKPEPKKVKEVKVEEVKKPEPKVEMVKPVETKIKF